MSILLISYMLIPFECRIHYKLIVALKCIAGQKLKLFIKIASKILTDFHVFSGKVGRNAHNEIAWQFSK